MILDSFYLLFKTDAGQAKNDVAELDKQISQLAAKGQKRSGEEQKELKELRKRRLENIQDLKDTTRETDKLGDSFTRLVEGSVSALTAYFSFQGIKAGLLDAEKLNNALEVQAKLTGQNAGELRGYAQALQNAGGNAQDFLSYITTQQQQAAAANIKLPQADVLLQRLHDLIKGKDITDQTRILGAAGALGLAPLLEKNDAEFQKDIENLKRHAEFTNQAASASRDFDAVWSETRATLTDVFSAIDADLLPALNDLGKSLTIGLHYLAEHKHVAEGLSVGIIGVSSAITLSLIPALGKMAVAAAAAAGPWGILFTTISGVATLIASHKEIADWIDNKIHGDEDAKLRSDYQAGVAAADKRRGISTGSPVKRSESQIGNTPEEQESFNFWISQGYSPAQAAGLVANEKRESGFKGAAAIGDNGQARGAFQWHPDRVKKIKDATGIDVTTAGHSEQLRAAAWELQNSGVAEQLKRAQTPEEAGAIVSNRFERPANGTQEAIIRGQMAAQVAQDQLARTPSALPWAQNSSVVGGDKTMSVSVGTVNVQTQATDAQGVAQAIGPALKNELRTTTSNWDDGVQI
jgi:hypothetical protein